MNHTLQLYKIYNISNKTTLFSSVTYRKRTLTIHQKHYTGFNLFFLLHNTEFCIVNSFDNWISKLRNFHNFHQTRKLTKLKCRKVSFAVMCFLVIFLPTFFTTSKWERTTSGLVCILTTSNGSISNLISEGQWILKIHLHSPAKIRGERNLW